MSIKNVPRKSAPLITERVEPESRRKDIENEKTNKEIFDKVESNNSIDDVFKDIPYDIQDKRQDSRRINSIFQKEFPDKVPFHTLFCINDSSINNFIINNKLEIEYLDYFIRYELYKMEDTEKREKFLKTRLNSDFEFIEEENNIIKVKRKNSFLFKFKLKNRKILCDITDVYMDFITDSILSNEEVKQLENILKEYLVEEKIENENMNYIFTDCNGSLYLKNFSIEKSEIDIDLNYNSDFKQVNDKILEKLNTGKKGCIILSGEKGTGKTYYIRWLTKNIDKKFVYVPRYFYQNLSSTRFLTFLLEYCLNSVLIFEDAEELVKSRESHDSNYLISDILEMADGLMSDILNVQMIFTFNIDCDNIDPALQRPGRIIARYDFKELDTEKSNKLAEKLGKNVKYNCPKTLAEIYNVDDMPVTNEVKEKKKFGFN